MSLIAEYTIETPILQDTLEAAPDMVLHTEAIHMRPERPTKSIIRARSGDFRTFERHLDDDPSIQEYEHLSDVGDQRLYRIVYTEEGGATLTYPVLAEHDAVLLDTTGTHEGLGIRARFPTRAALAAYREACRERDVPFSLRSLYREEQLTNDGGTTSPYGLTDPQREALSRALGMGYFAVPRQTTLAEIGDELGISVQAVSTRLRRGQQNLLRYVLGPDKGLSE